MIQLYQQIVLLLLDAILLERIYKIIVTINEKNRDQNLQFDIKVETAKILARSPGKIDKYEYLTGAEILPLIKVK